MSPDGYGRYLLPEGEITFYLEIDRATEPTRRVRAKLDGVKATEAPLVPVVFDRYVNSQHVSSMLDKWLNENGYRTKRRRLWSTASVITILRNRAYIGEIYYRGNWYPAPHEPLIPTKRCAAAHGTRHSAVTAGSRLQPS